MVSDSVISALQAASRIEPGNADLHLHLADLLLQAGRAAEALFEARQVLLTQPDRLEALRFAAWAAEEVGDTEALPPDQRRADRGGSGCGPENQSSCSDCAGRARADRRTPAG